MSLLEFRVPTWILLAKPLFRWSLLYKAPHCEASFITLSKGADFIVFLLPAALPSGRNAYLYLGCGDLALLQNILEEFHRGTAACGCRPQ